MGPCPHPPTPVYNDRARCPAGRLTVHKGFAPTGDWAARVVV